MPILIVSLFSDLLLVEGNPPVELSAVTYPDNLKVIMKDGIICKNTLYQS